MCLLEKEGRASRRETTIRSDYEKKRGRGKENERKDERSLGAKRVLVSVLHWIRAIHGSSFRTVS